jgi:hypothetical protein
MHDPLTFERRLADAYERYLAAAPISIDAREIAANTPAAGRQASRSNLTFFDPRVGLDRRWVAILVAALVLASLVAFGVGRWLDRNTQPPLSDPHATPSMEAIYVRASGRGDADVVAVRPDGTEGIVRHLSSAMLPGGLSFAPNGHVSEDGWIALGTEMAPGGWASGGPNGGWALFDLGDPSPVARFVETLGGPSSAWSPNGWFASPYGNQCCAMQLTDPRSGEIVRTGTSTFLPGGGPSTIWATDGSGLLVVRGGAGEQRHYGLLPRSGGPAVDIVPELAFREPRYVAAGGATLVRCTVSFTACPESGVWVFDDGKAPLEWLGGELPDLMGASFSADGRSVWLMFDQASGGGHDAVLAIATAPGVITTVWRRALPADVSGLTLGAFALDDSMVVVWLWDTEGEFTVDRGELLVSLPDGNVTSPSGAFGGFTRGSAVESWR